MKSHLLVRAQLHLCFRTSYVQFKFSFRSLCVLAETPCNTPNHYRCLDNLQCGDYRCNSVKDCPGGEDENCCQGTKC